MLPKFKLLLHKQKMCCNCQREMPVWVYLHLPGAPRLLPSTFSTEHCITVLVQPVFHRCAGQSLKTQALANMVSPENFILGLQINYVFVWPCRPPLWGPTKWHHFNIITIIPSYLKGIDSNLKIYECSCYITWHNIYICTIHTPFLSFLI